VSLSLGQQVPLTNGEPVRGGIRTLGSEPQRK
jgi:hypothetical protein